MKLTERIKQGTNPNILPSTKDNCVAKFIIDGREIEIKNHAFENFFDSMEKAPSNDREKYSLIRNFYSLIKGSDEVTRSNNVKQIIKYGFEEAEYRYKSGWILVICNGVLKTAYEKGPLKGTPYSRKNQSR